MYANVIRLVIAVLIAIVLGNMCHPDGPLGGFVVKLFHDRDEKIAALHREDEARKAERLRRLEEARKLIRRERPKAVVVEEDGATDDWEAGFADTGSTGDDSDIGAIPDEEPVDAVDGDGFAEGASFMLRDVKAQLYGITEDPDAEETPGQSDVVPKPSEKSLGVAAMRTLATHLERAEKESVKKPYVNEEFDVTEWKKPGEVYKKLAERVSKKLGSKPTPVDVCKFLESPENRLDLARLTLIRQASVRGLTEVVSKPMGASMLAAVSSDLEWITQLLYSGPTTRLQRGLEYLTTIYKVSSEDMEDPVVRRIATTTALEFGREGWPEDAMLKRYLYYNASYQQGRLNKIFDTLRYWETRIVTGHTEYNGWGSPESLAWQRDNSRLPQEGYLGASGQLVYRLRNVAGDSVFSNDYLAPYIKAVGRITAKAHRDIGGVCGACSHFGAYGALAVGLPAMTMGEPGHCAYTVRVGDQWRKGYSIYWQHGMHKTFWGLHDWEFLILTQELYGKEPFKTLAADQMRAAAEFLAARKLTASAMQCFDTATNVQPLSWTNWLAYAGYLAQKAPQDKERWKDLSERVTATMGANFHDAAATMQARYIYPQLLPLLPEFRERNNLFAAFFKQCKTYGVHTWDISLLLNTQLNSFTNDKDKLNYMRAVLPNLMSKPDYSGAVLAWGLDVISKLSDGSANGSVESDGSMQEEFSKMITRSMQRMGSSSRDRDKTWAGLGQAIAAAAENGDTRTFQAIGKLAMRKCKNYFPKNKIKIRPFPGRIVSATGLITTATTLDDSGTKRSCLHWGVLQKTGGSIPTKFEGQSGIVVKLEGECDFTGLVALFNGKIKDDRRFYLESSIDGRNWSSVDGKAEISNNLMRFDLKNAHASGRYIRLLREGDKWDSGTITGFYVYGKPHKN